MVKLEGAQLEVLEMEQHRITKVMFENNVSAENEGEASAETSEDAVGQKDFIRSAAKHILSEKPKTSSSAAKEAGDAEQETHERAITDENNPTISGPKKPGAKGTAPIGHA
mgnify:CR=1 FL=1